MNFTGVFTKMVELFFIVLVGYGASKAHVLGREARSHLTSLVLNVSIPATVLSSVMMQEELPGRGQVASLLLVASLSYVILLGAAFLFPVFLRVPERQKGIYEYMIAFGNVGFIGFPVTQAIFGAKALFYTCIFNLPFNLLAYSVGVMMIQGKGSQNGGKEERRKMLIRNLLSPCLLSSFAALALALFQCRGPVILGETCEILGQITTPAALLIIGSCLADMPVRAMFSNFRVYLMAAIRLIVLPLLVYAVFCRFVTDPMLLGVAVIIAAMPVATNCTMFCIQYGADEDLASQGTFITTLLSVLTIPLLASLLF